MAQGGLVDQLASMVEQNELRTIDDINLVSRLRSAVSRGGGIQRFGKLFHPIRYSFVHVNFIVGSRQEMHEIFWAGLARNLYEEAGGGVTAPHNELYREFLRSIGINSDAGIGEIRFSQKFNSRWREFARSSAVEDAVLGIAVYEILDRPDYTSLHNALKGLNDKWALEFFRLHSAVEHFDMFSEFVAWFYETVPNPESRFEEVSGFVLNTQKDMWLSLIEELEHAEIPQRPDSDENFKVKSSREIFVS